MKKTLFFAIFCFLTAVPAYAGQIQISTYYPSPFGYYERLKFNPRLVLTEPCEVGTVYYLSGTGLKYCAEDTTWKNIGGSVWNQLNDNISPIDTAINPNLQIGIGTDAPTSSLHVYAPEGYTPAGVFLDTADMDVNGGPDGQFRLRNNSLSGTQKMFFGGAAGDVLTVDTQAGNVGIGTTSPGSKLHVRGADDTAEVVAFMSGTDTIAAGTPSLNVGIGTTAPTDTLTVDGTFGTTGNAFIDSNLNIGIVPHVDSGMSIYAWSNQAAYAFLQGSGDTFNYAALSLSDASATPKYWQIRHGKAAAFLNKFNFAYYNGTAWLYPMTIDTIGNVGIGTTNPLYPFVVERSLSGMPNTCVLINTQAPAADTGTKVRIVGPSDITIGEFLGAWEGGATTDSYVSFTTRGNNTITEKMRITSTGNVGIGTNAPATKLEVSGGAIKATGGLIIETRTTNPGSPVNGQMWLCTDTGDATPCNGI